MEEIPYGYCHCGCGQKTSINKRNRYDKNQVKGEPARFIRGHVGLPENRYEIDSVTGCWNWLGFVRKRDGYAKLSKGNFHGHPIRYFYEKLIGEIPKGYEIDHLCKNRRCCNPYHGEAVTTAVNRQRRTNTKLNMTLVAEIRALRGYLSSSEASKIYGIASSNIRRIWRNEIWVVQCL